MKNKQFNFIPWGFEFNYNVIFKRLRYSLGYNFLQSMISFDKNDTKSVNGSIFGLLFSKPMLSLFL